MTEDQILEFNRVAIDIDADLIQSSTDEKTGEQEISQITTQEVKNYGIEPDFELSEIVEFGVSWLGAKIDFTDSENLRISSATNKVLNYHNINIDNIHPYTNAFLTTFFIVLKHKGGNLLEKIKGKFKRKSAKHSTDTQNIQDMQDMTTDSTNREKL